MTSEQVGETAVRKPLRLWPGVAVVAVQWVARYGAPKIEPDWTIYGILASVACGLLVLLWWLFFSRAAWLERIGAVVVVVAGMLAAKALAHESIATGAMGMLFPILAIPAASLAFVVWAVVSRNWSNGTRRVAMVAAVALGWGVWTLARTDGFSGSGVNYLHWRWEPTAEERLVAAAGPGPMAPTAPAAAKGAGPEVAAKGAGPEVAAKGAAPEMAAAPKHEHSADPAPVPKPAEVRNEPMAAWPGFRGPGRDGVVPGPRIQTDWTANKPVELWRRAVGPAWSSFAVRGDLIYTQEQRGPDEVVSCYRLATGEPVWMHKDAARFWESNGGPGPRGTPEFARGRVYTFGGTGILNALDADTGAVAWSRNAAKEAGTTLPTWGYSSSPLVVGEMVVVASSGRIVAYDAATGARRWMGPKAGASYSTPRLVTEGGTAQLVLLSAVGVTSFAPADGTQLWRHEWEGYPIVQPGLTPDGDLLISVKDQSGLRRLNVARGGEGWKVEERWTTMGLKPYFSDFVVHRGHAYGFDGGILSCIGLEDGKRKWKGGRYGHGQMVLLAAQDLLLVLSEEGEVALVSATPEKFREVGRFKAIEGKTWNHPVVAGEVLLVRNGEEMAAFRLPVER